MGQVLVAYLGCCSSLIWPVLRALFGVFLEPDLACILSCCGTCFEPDLATSGLGWWFRLSPFGRLLNLK